MRLAAIASLLIAGIFAGAQLGKVAPLVGWYQDQGFSLVLVGWLTSMIGVFVALVALPAGWAIERAGVRRAVLVGSLFLAAGGLALPFLHTSNAILVARLVEGIGYVFLVISLPSVLTVISPPQWRGPVLAIWSCFVPVGYAISDLIARAMLPGFEPQAYLLVIALGYALFAGFGILLLRSVEDAADGRAGAERHSPSFMATLNIPVFLIALAFGCFVVQSVSLFSFAPAFIAEGAGLLLSAGVITLFTPIGNILAGFLVRGASARRIAVIAIGFLAFTAVTTATVFSGTLPFVATVAAVLFCIVSGVVGSVLFAVIPLVVPKDGSVPVAIGLVAQAGGIGTLFGPPLAALVIETGGWQGLGLYLAAIGLAGIIFILPNALRRSDTAAA